MGALPPGLTADQFVAGLFQINPAFAYRFLDDGSYEWRGPGDYPGDAAVESAWTTFAANEAASVAAESLDQPVTDLASARTSYATDATALTNAKTAVTNANATVQGLAASPSIANLTAAVKALSTAQAQADLAILNSLKDLADGELAIANALAALKARG